VRTKSTVSYELERQRSAPPTAVQKAELAALAALPDEQIDTSDIPPLPETFWQNAVPNPFDRPVKQQMTVRLDADVLALDRPGIPIEAQRHPASGDGSHCYEALTTRRAIRPSRSCAVPPPADHSADR
jgi:uncharacterized protein (DUF4415 family)